MALSSDQPIRATKEDKAGWDNAAKFWAKQVDHRDRREPLTIGISGAWGSGKTSFVNLILETLRKKASASRDQDLIIMEFKPWLLSRQDNLVHYFFNELISSIKNATSTGKKTRALVNALLKYRKAIQILSATNPITHVVGEVGLAVLEGVKKEQDNPENIYELKRKIEEILGKKEGPASFTPHIVIAIDDVDRLLKSEMLELFQLVRCIADFPNVTYLVAYEQEMVLNALRDQVGINTKEYLEKIFHVSVQVPSISRGILKKQFDTSIQQSWGARTQEYFPSNALKENTRIREWGDIFSQFIKKDLVNFRQISRFRNLLLAHVQPLGGDIDPHDLTLWCWILTLEPELPARILAHQRTSPYERFSMSDDIAPGSKEEKAKFLDNFTGSLQKAIRFILFNSDSASTDVYRKPPKGALVELKNLQRLLQWSCGMEEYMSPLQAESALRGVQSMADIELLWEKIPRPSRAEILDQWSEFLQHSPALLCSHYLTVHLLRMLDFSEKDGALGTMGNELWSQAKRCIVHAVKNRYALSTQPDANLESLYDLIQREMQNNDGILSMPLALVRNLVRTHTDRTVEDPLFPIVQKEQLEALQISLRDRIVNNLSSGWQHIPELFLYALSTLKEWGTNKEELLGILGQGAEMSDPLFIESLRFFMDQRSGAESERIEFDWLLLEATPGKDRNYWQQGAERILPIIDNDSYPWLLTKNQLRQFIEQGRKRE